MYHELFEELDAFDPRWRINFSSVISAAKAAGAESLLDQYLQTPEGEGYLANVAAVRDYLAEIEEHKRLVALEEGSLKFGYHNLGSVKGGYFA